MLFDHFLDDGQVRRSDLAIAEGVEDGIYGWWRLHVQSMARAGV
jgi:hypothetical protein